MDLDTLLGTGESITADEARQYITTGESDRFQLIDIRQPAEYRQGHIPGAILIPLSELPEKLTTLNLKKPVIVYCRSGVRSKAACHILTIAVIGQNLTLSCQKHIRSGGCIPQRNGVPVDLDGHHRRRSSSQSVPLEHIHLFHCGPWQQER